MIREFIKYYKPHKKLFMFDMFCSFLIALTDLFYPIITKNIIIMNIVNMNIANVITNTIMNRKKWQLISLR